jgi:radical SAM family uncharacterized protein
MGNRRTALPESVLLSVEKPARYIGAEYNSVVKNPDEVKVRFVMCFPDVYEIGMSYLGIQIIYDMLNKRPDVWCERVYSPWPDLDRVLRDRKLPLFSLESQEPVKNADILGFTLQYEMCYTNVLQVLDLSGIPLRSKDRSDDDPIVIGGGPCTYNPEPVAPFFDLFYIGEAETQMDHLVDLLEECKAAGLGRSEYLRRAAKIPGMYVPALYEPEYNDDGTLAAFRPVLEDIPARIKRQAVSNRDISKVPYPERPVVPYIQVTQDRVVLEIMRGCIRGCRFCQAGMIYRPLREKDHEVLLKNAEAMLKSTGYAEVSLSSLSSSDYSGIKPLIDGLIDYCSAHKVNIALPSLRIDAFSLDVMKKIQDVKKSSLTFAPEGGTQRIRNVINKGLTEEDIMEGALQAFKGGWNRVKLYFMLGLPTETEEDMRGIAELSERIAELYYRNMPPDKRKGKIQITASASFFVPKPFTPFQWAVMEEQDEYLRRAYYVKDAMREQHNRKSMSFSYHDATATILEGVLARGDRRVADVIEKAYLAGSIFDAWSDYLDYDRWMKAFEACGLDAAFYTSRQRGLDELFPWDFIDIGVSKSFLRREWQRALAGEVTPNCREGCGGCGASVLGGDCCP